MQDENNVLNDYIVVKALEDGVNIMGLTRGQSTKFHHTEKLDKGEVYIAQFTQTTSAIKINGNAEIMTKHGNIKSGDNN
ncbi:MAG: trp RNA-binding attenuation protein MtrB [Clostridia bacterium]|nr:trp RNA-binding attenuation protein MtrB [Clostridia bacterium]MBQ7751582.1 trp RNA-binding attenuation protein MtrB [Clostridia bacterium]